MSDFQLNDHAGRSRPIQMTRRISRFADGRASPWDTQFRLDRLGSFSGHGFVAK